LRAYANLSRDTRLSATLQHEPAAHLYTALERRATLVARTHLSPYKASSKPRNEGAREHAINPCTTTISLTVIDRIPVCERPRRATWSDSRTPWRHEVRARLPVPAGAVFLKDGRQ